MNAYTTIEESKQLIEAGLDADTADMYTYKNIYTGALSCFNNRTLIGNYNLLENKDVAHPCWSLAALLEIIPKQLHINNNAWEIYVPVIYLGEKCVVAYQHSNIFMHSEYSDTNIEAVYKMVIWLLENNYIKSNKNE